MSTRNDSRLRTRWSAIGAAVAVSMGAGGVGLTHATINSGDKPVTITIDAERILDTRIDVGLTDAFSDATPRDLQVSGPVQVAPSGIETVVPADASSVLVNVTVVLPSDPGFLALRPAGATGEPTTSTVNFFPGTVEPNAATVDLSDSGAIEIWLETASDTGSAHVLLDVVGYTVDHTHDDRYYTKGEVESLVMDSFGTASASGSDVFDLPVIPTYADMATLIFTAPEDGAIVSTASAYVALPAGIATTCRLTLDGAVLTSTLDQVLGEDSTNGFALTDGAGVTAGVHTLKLQCTTLNGSGADLLQPRITVVYTASPL